VALFLTKVIWLAYVVHVITGSLLTHKKRMTRDG